MIYKMNDKTDCLLVHVPKLLNWEPFPGWYSKVNFIAVGMFSILEELEKNNINSHILHLGLEKKIKPDFSLIDYVKTSGTKVVAFSLHWHMQIFDTIEAAREIKEKLPETFIIMGGFTASYFAKQILEEYPCVDFIIRGDGEIPLSALIKTLNDKTKELSEIPNLTWKNKDGMIINNEILYVANEEDINRWTFSEMNKLRNYEKYLKLNWMCPLGELTGKEFELTEPTFFGLSFGRGCTGTCTWCAGSAAENKNFTGRCRPVWREPEKILLTIKDLRKYGFKRFYVCFDPHPKDQTKLIKIFEKLGSIKPPVKMDFECFSLPSEELIKSFKKNLHVESVIYISPETGDEKLRKIHRGFFFSNKKLEETLEILDREEIPCVLFFTTGLPGEDYKSFSETKDYKQMIKNKYSSIIKINTQPLEIEPGSPWFENPDKYKIKLKRMSLIDFYETHKKHSFSTGYDTEYLKEEEILSIHRMVNLRI